MSGQIDYQLLVTDTYGTKKKTVVQGSTKVTVAADLINAGTMSVPTTAGGTVVPLGSVTTLGWLYMRNMDPTNTIKFGPTVTGAIVDFGQMKPGEDAWFRLVPGVVPRVIALVAPCNLDFKVYSE